jgi:hypothetical protein
VSRRVVVISGDAIVGIFGAVAGVLGVIASLWAFKVSRQLTIEAEEVAARAVGSQLFQANMAQILSPADQATIGENAGAVHAILDALRSVDNTVLLQGNLLIVKSGDLIVSRILDGDTLRRLVSSPESMTSADAVLELIRSDTGPTGGDHSPTDSQS